MDKEWQSERSAKLLGASVCRRCRQRKFNSRFSLGLQRAFPKNPICIKCVNELKIKRNKKSLTKKRFYDKM